MAKKVPEFKALDPVVVVEAMQSNSKTKVQPTAGRAFRKETWPSRLKLHMGIVRGERERERERVSERVRVSE